MTNIYLLVYKVNNDNLPAGILTFTRKEEAVQAAKYYRDNMHCFSVTLRHDKQCHSGWSDIKGFIDF